LNLLSNITNKEDAAATVEGRHRLRNLKNLNNIKCHGKGYCRIGRVGNSGAVDCGHEHLQMADRRSDRALYFEQGHLLTIPDKGTDRLNRATAEKEIAI
jgi:hypothetical protein